MAAPPETVVATVDLERLVVNITRRAGGSNEACHLGHRVSRMKGRTIWTTSRFPSYILKHSQHSKKRESDGTPDERRRRSRELGR